MLTSCCLICISSDGYAVECKATVASDTIIQVITMSYQQGETKTVSQKTMWFLLFHCFSFSASLVLSKIHLNLCSSNDLSE